MVPKFDLQIQALGDLDELQSWLGVILSQFSTKTQVIAPELQGVQRDLYYFQSDLNVATSHKITSAHTTQLEQRIDFMMAKAPALKGFILPGGQVTGANLQYARTLARRAERSVIALHVKQQPVAPELLQYLNRLSDYFFASARYANWLDGYKDVLSKP